MSKSIVIAYHSGYGHTSKIAEIVDGDIRTAVLFGQRVRATAARLA